MSLSIDAYNFNHILMSFHFCFDDIKETIEDVYKTEAILLKKMITYINLIDMIFKKSKEYNFDLYFTNDARVVHNILVVLTTYYDNCRDIFNNHYLKIMENAEENHNENDYLEVCNVIKERIDLFETYKKIIFINKSACELISKNLFNIYY